VLLAVGGAWTILNSTNHSPDMTFHDAEPQPNLAAYKEMEKPVEICTFELDILLVDKEGSRLPTPMITVAVDSEAQVLIGVYISTATP